MIGFLFGFPSVWKNEWNKFQLQTGRKFWGRNCQDIIARPNFNVFEYGVTYKLPFDPISFSKHDAVCTNKNDPVDSKTIYSFVYGYL